MSTFEKAFLLKKTFVRDSIHFIILATLTTLKVKKGLESANHYCDSFSYFFPPQKDGQIDADELQRCLTQSGIAGGYKRKCLQKYFDVSHFRCYL